MRTLPVAAEFLSVAGRYDLRVTDALGNNVAGSPYIFTMVAGEVTEASISGPEDGVVRYEDQELGTQVFCRVFMYDSFGNVVLDPVAAELAVTYRSANGALTRATYTPGPASLALHAVATLTRTGDTVTVTATRAGTQVTGSGTIVFTTLSTLSAENIDAAASLLASAATIPAANAMVTLPAGASTTLLVYAVDAFGNRATAEAGLSATLVIRDSLATGSGTPVEYPNGLCASLPAQVVAAWEPSLQAYALTFAVGQASVLNLELSLISPTSVAATRRRWRQTCTAGALVAANTMVDVSSDVTLPAGETGTFCVLMRDSGFNVISNPLLAAASRGVSWNLVVTFISVDDPSVTMEGAYSSATGQRAGDDVILQRPITNGRVTFEYSPTVAGLYEIYLAVNLEEVACQLEGATSNFQVLVEAGLLVDFTDSVLDTSSLDPEAPAGTPSSFSFTLRDTFGNAIMTPDFDRVAVDLSVTHIDAVLGEHRDSFIWRFRKLPQPPPLVPLLKHPIDFKKEKNYSILRSPLLHGIPPVRLYVLIRILLHTSGEMVTQLPLVTDGRSALSLGGGQSGYTVAFDAATGEYTIEYQSLISGALSLGVSVDGTPLSGSPVVQLLNPGAGEISPRPKRFPPTGDLGHRGVRGAAGLRYRSPPLYRFTLIVINSKVLLLIRRGLLNSKPGC